MDILLTLIVPVYNAEKYLDECISTIVSQTYTCWELILVDDGSKDASAQICDSWAAKDNRIKVIHKQNGGVSSSRNVGLNEARGKYVLFIDADDKIDENYCSSLASQMEEHVDLCICGYNEVLENEMRPHAAAEKAVYSLEQLKENYDSVYDLELINPPWCKIYSRELIASQRFDENSALGEDYLFNLEYMEKCESISIIPYCGYFYNNCNSGSATKRIRENDFKQLLVLHRRAKEFRYNGEKEKIDVIDKNLCRGVIGLIQLMCYNRVENRGKIIKTWLSDDTFKRVCEGNYGFSAKYRIPQKLCKCRCVVGLRSFFCIKKALARVCGR